MEFLRYVFLILILTLSTSIGFLISKKYTERTKELNSLANLINILQTKIKFTHKPLGEILQEIANLKEHAGINNIFLKTYKNLQTQKFETAWNEAIKEQRVFLNLKLEDINLIKTLGNSLGKTDIEGQMSEINQFQLLLQAQIKKSTEESIKNSKMYKSLGTIIGLAIITILF